LQRQKELTQELEDERKAKGKELELVMIVVLRETESREVKWREKAQALALALAKSEMAHGTRREETAIPQSMVSVRDTDWCQVGSVTDRQPTKRSIKESGDVPVKRWECIFPQIVDLLGPKAVTAASRLACLCAPARDHPPAGMFSARPRTTERTTELAVEIKSKKRGWVIGSLLPR